jgi:uncharacterized LabA/DUF88 family protein
MACGLAHFGTKQNFCPNTCEKPATDLKHPEDFRKRVAAWYSVGHFAIQIRLERLPPIASRQHGTGHHARRIATKKNRRHTTQVSQRVKTSATGITIEKGRRRTKKTMHLSQINDATHQTRVPTVGALWHAQA